MTLLSSLTDQIRREGPIPISDYMAQALGHPEYGYYLHRDPLGEAGDFTTAPEISQVFGELIGLWCADAWQQMGCPPTLQLIELGPGRGTLMSDALRAGRALPGFVEACSVHLVETSPTLREAQQLALAGTPCQWHECFDSVPDNGPFLLIANELFDALPIEQYIGKNGAWHQQMVGLDKSDALCLTPSAEPVIGEPLPPALRSIPPQEGEIAEDCPSGRALVRDISTRLARWGGAALLIDYGYMANERGDTLQALKDHHYHPVLENPGEADLTAHVDFRALQREAHESGAQSLGPVTQRDFLLTLGIGLRVAALAQGVNRRTAEELVTAAERLTAPDQMGLLFKVLALTGGKMELAGFA